MGADQVMMRFEIAVHAQRGRMRSNLSQQPTLDEKPQVVVDRGERNGWNPAPDRSENIFRGIVSVGSNHGLIDDLTLVRDRQTVLRGQFAELSMGEAHNYRMRMIIKLSRALSTEILPFSSRGRRPEKRRNKITWPQAVRGTPGNGSRQPHLEQGLR